VLSHCWQAEGQGVVSEAHAVASSDEEVAPRACPMRAVFGGGRNGRMHMGWAGTQVECMYSFAHATWTGEGGFAVVMSVLQVRRKASQWEKVVRGLLPMCMQNPTLI